jgi:hypothetical protein
MRIPRGVVGPMTGLVIKEGHMQLYSRKQLADSIRTVRKNTVLIAEDIPEQHYGYRPTADSRSVAEILTHIAMMSEFDRLLHQDEHVATLEGFDFRKLVRMSEIEEKKSVPKTELIELLRTSGEGWARWLEALPGRIKTSLRSCGPRSIHCVRRIIGFLEACPRQVRYSGWQLVEGFAPEASGDVLRMSKGPDYLGTVLQPSNLLAFLNAQCSTSQKRN